MMLLSWKESYKNIELTKENSWHRKSNKSDFPLRHIPDSILSLNLHNKTQIFTTMAFSEKSFILFAQLFALCHLPILFFWIVCQYLTFLSSFGLCHHFSIFNLCQIFCIVTILFFFAFCLCQLFSKFCLFLHIF